jgi:hypothetical protein
VTPQEIPQYVTVVRRTPEGTLAAEVYTVLHAEPIQRFALDIAPYFAGGVVPPGVEMKSRTWISELETYQDELWLLEYEQPLPVLFSVGYGGPEARPFTGYKYLSPMYYPPRGTLAVSQTVAAGSTATLAAAISRALAPAVGQQYVPLEVLGVYAHGPSGAVLELRDSTALGTAVLLRAAVPLVEPRFRARVYGALVAAASGGDIAVTVVLRWRSRRHVIALGFGEQVYVTALNLTGQLLSSLPVQLWGVRYRVRPVPEAREPRGPLIFMHPYPRA